MMFSWEKTKISGLRFLPTNSSIDRVLGGGFPTDIISHVYGPPASGKTSIAIKLLVNAVKAGFKAAYIDPEGSFHLSRVEQVSGDLFDKVLENTVLLEPESLAHQTEIINRLVNREFRLIIADPITYHYRLELDRTDPFPVNHELSKQLAMLASHARKRNAVVLVTNQVYSDMKGGYEPLAKEPLGYGAKLALELGILGNLRTARLVKHPYRKPGEVVKFKITNLGVE